jgi:hypothetical protein
MVHLARVAVVASLVLVVVAVRSARAAGTTAEMAEGETIVQDIMAHDKRILTRWTTERAPGTVTINIYGVADAPKQDAIVSWVKALKRRGDVSLPVNIRFYKRANLIEEPNSPIRGWRRHGPEHLIRSERI